MIRYIKGRIKDLAVDKVVLLTPAGIGFQIQIHPRIYKKIKGLQETSLRVRMILRENFFAFYAFEDEREEYLFIQLEKIHKIGAKIAYNILRFADFETIRKKIQEKDIAFFQQVPKVGRKSAQKVVFELAEKIMGDFEAAEFFPQQEDKMLNQALRSLGFSADDIKKISGSIQPDLPLEEKIKAALKKIGK